MEPTTGTGGMGAGALGDPREMGTALLREGRFDEAASVLREAVSVDPSDEGAWRMLGAALSQKGDHSAAVEAFQQAANLEPMAAKSQYNLGLALQGAGRIGEARTALEKAIALDPGYEQAKQRLAELGGGASAGAPPTLGTVGSAASMLSSVGQAPAPPPPPPSAPGGLGTIGGGSPGGLSGVGSGSFAPPPPPPVTPASLDTPSYGGAPPTLRPPSLGEGGPVNTGGGYAPPPVLGMNYGTMQNSSGMQGDVPQEARGWNWGAMGLGLLGFGWTWAFSHKNKSLGWGLIGLNVASRLINRNTDSAAIGLLFFVAYIGVGIFLGLKGNEIGWQNRRFDSVEDFKACQRIWGWWALGVWALLIVAVIAIIAIAGAAVLGGLGGARRP